MSSRKSEKRNAKMPIRLDPEVKGALELLAARESAKKGGKRVTHNEVIKMLFEQSYPELLEESSRLAQSEKDKQA